MQRARAAPPAAAVADFAKEMKTSHEQLCIRMKKKKTKGERSEDTLCRGLKVILEWPHLIASASPGDGEADVRHSDVEPASMPWWQGLRAVANLPVGPAGTQNR